MRLLLLFIPLIFFLTSCESTFTQDVSSIVRNKTATYFVSSSNGYSVHGGYGTSCAHPGAHALFNAGTYPVFAVTDGVIVDITDCKQAGANAKYDIIMAIGMKGAALVNFEYSLEPFGGTTCNFTNQILVRKGQKVTKGQTIANFVAVGAGAHIHFNLKADGATICPDIFPASVFASQTGAKSGCAAAASNTFCHSLTSSEDPSVLQ